MKYKEAGKKGVMSSLYSTLPETLETQHAKEASQLQSQVSAGSQTPAEWPKASKHLSSCQNRHYWVCT